MQGAPGALNRRDHPHGRLGRRAGIHNRSPRLLPQRHGAIPDAHGVRGRGRHPPFHLLVDGRGLRNTSAIPVGEDAPLRPVSRYGTSKMMTELMLGDTAKAHDLRYVALRYFNVAGADPAGRTGQSTRGATHLVKVACEAATGRRDGIDVFGMDYPTRDGTCIRDFIHAKDLALAHSRRSPLASGEQRTVTDAELRLFKRLLRPRGDQSSGASIGARAHGARRSQAPQRRHRDRRRLSPAALRAQLDSAPRRHRWHRAGCLALGARIGRQLAAVAVPHVC